MFSKAIGLWKASILLLPPWKDDEYVTRQWIQFGKHWIKYLDFQSTWVPPLDLVKSRSWKCESSVTYSSRGRDAQYKWVTFSLSYYLTYYFITAIQYLTSFSSTVSFLPLVRKWKKWSTCRSIHFLSIAKNASFCFDYKLMTLQLQGHGLVFIPILLEN